MMLDRMEFRLKYLNRVHLILDARIQVVEGISSRISEKYDMHRILWDLEGCTKKEAINSLLYVKRKYNLGRIYILSDREKSFGAVCNTIVTLKEYLHILIDTDYMDKIYIKYVLQRNEGILRLSDKENRPIHRDIIYIINRLSNRLINETDYYTLKYETGYIKDGINVGNFYNDNKGIIN